MNEKIRSLYEMLENALDRDSWSWDWSAFETGETQDMIRSLDSESLRKFKEALVDVANADVYPSCITRALASNPSEDSRCLREYLDSGDYETIQCAMKNPSTRREDIDELFTRDEQREILGMVFDIDYPKNI